MHIHDIFKSKERTFSFEFFPPKTQKGFESLKEAISTLKKYSPDFVSITYGAMGSSQEMSLNIVDYIENTAKLTSMAHLTCVGASEEQITKVLNSFAEKGVKNIMALRGDPPKGQDSFVPADSNFSHATDLIQFIKKLGGFSIGAAGYPEGHIDSKSFEKDLEFLKMKQDLGADFIVTQLFLNNDFYFRYVEKLRTLGVNLRIIPGIMPILNYKQIKTFSTMCGCSIPIELEKDIVKHQDSKDDLRKIGIDYAIKQSENLLKGGAPGLHFYTLNKSSATRDIYEAII